MLEHASQKDSHGVSANVLDEDVLEQICWTYADPDEKDLVRYNDFVDALVLSAPMPKIPKLSACGVAGSAAVAAANLSGECSSSLPGSPACWPKRAGTGDATHPPRRRNTRCKVDS